MANVRPNIWQLQSRRDLPGLIDALSYPDPDVRRRAAVALQTLDALAAIPDLKLALHRETDADTREHLATALQALDQRTDVQRMLATRNARGLVKALSSRHPEQVIAAARALGHLGDLSAVEPLIVLFHHGGTPSAIRLAAAEALLELKSAPAVVTLLGALRRESWEVRRNAAAVLGQIQATWAVAPLAQALQDPHPVVRRTAAAALSRIGTTEAIAALREQIATPKRSPRPPAPDSRPPIASRAPLPALPPAQQAAQESPSSPRLPAETPSPPARPMLPDVVSQPRQQRPPQAPRQESPPQPASAPPATPAVDRLPQAPDTPPDVPEHAPDHAETRAAHLMQPVMKLIGFLKQRVEK